MKILSFKVTSSGGRSQGNHGEGDVCVPTSRQVREVRRTFQENNAQEVKAGNHKTLPAVFRKLIYFSWPDRCAGNKTPSDQTINLFGN